MAESRIPFRFRQPQRLFRAQGHSRRSRSRTGATFDYVPALLGGIFKLTNNKPPMLQFQGIKNKLAYEQLEMQPLHRPLRPRRNSGSIRIFPSTR